ncbi:HTH-type transcriptional activator RhaS [Paenibacillus solanacearum]|uniref:HTH-type transcriptional activator RhaS n=1 Tax=Paenibacillus solanacearum TaxID=2048548 RepID=A0A916JRH6_9BACL|nr:AraC family transcriptional regulator [Paenibacillus solanacearum]CAG7597238.1 HTH-type transcriptional activator RhaS [Paenibacillus solanacearum]
MKIPVYRWKVDYLTRYSDFNPLLLFAQKYEFTPQEYCPLRLCYAHAVILIEDGCGTLLLNGKEHRLQPGSLVYIAAGLPHQWVTDEREPMVHRCAYFDWRYVHRPEFHYQRDYFKGADRPFMEERASSMPGLQLHQVMKVNNIALWLSYFNAFTQPPSILGVRSPIESLQYNAAFQTFLHHYLTLAARNDAWCDPRIAQLLDKIDNAPLEQAESELYVWAKGLGMGRSRFHHLFKQETGLTPHEYIQRRRLHQAADDLTETDLTVTEIAHKHGFSSIHYFSKAFSHAMGISPSQYRQQRLR